MFKKYFLYILIAFVFFGLFVFFKISDQKKEKEAEKYEVIDTFYEQLSEKCEKGEWVNFPLLEEPETGEEFIDNVKLNYLEETGEIVGSDSAQVFFTDKDYFDPLSFFIGREVRIEGKKAENNRIYIAKIKCVGAEAKPNIVNERQELMQYIGKNINSLALEKTPRDDWQVDVFYFAENGDAYVQYESKASWEEEVPFDGRLWLIRPSNLDRSIPTIETLAYIWENAGELGENVVKVGEDIHEDEEVFTIYEFDEETEKWVLQ